MTRNVPILDCAPDRVKYIFNQSEADRNQEFQSRLIWVVKGHRYGISALVPLKGNFFVASRNVGCFIRGSKTLKHSVVERI